MLDRSQPHARATPPSEPSPRPADLLLDGLALLITDGHTAGTPVLRNALRAFQHEGVVTPEGLRFRWLAGRSAGFIWDYESWDSLTIHQIRAAREVGRSRELPLALSTRVGVHIFAGRTARPASLVQEADAVAEAIDVRIVPAYHTLALAAFRGREDEVDAVGPCQHSGLHRTRRGPGITLSHWVTAALLQHAHALRRGVHRGRTGGRGSP